MPAYRRAFRTLGVALAAGLLVGIVFGPAQVAHAAGCDVPSGSTWADAASPGSTSRTITRSAPASGQSHYVTSVTASDEGSTVHWQLTIEDGATVKWRMVGKASSVHVQFPYPVRIGGQLKVVLQPLATSAANHHLSATGFTTATDPACEVALKAGSSVAVSSLPGVTISGTPTFKCLTGVDDGECRGSGGTVALDTAEGSFLWSWRRDTLLASVLMAFTAGALLVRLMRARRS